MARRRDDDDDDYEDEDRPRKKRKQQSSNSTTIIIVLAVGFGASFFCCIPIMIALLLPAVQQAREAARRTESKNRLKQIGLAAHNFHDVHAHFPPLNAPPITGEVPQSWMTDLLPYVDQAAVYNQINRKAPWNDPSNQTMMRVIITTYLNPTVRDDKDSVTGYAFGHYAGNVRIFGGEKPISIRDIRDGTSNTILAGSVTNGLRPWGDPTNLRDPGAGMGPGPNQFVHGYSAGANGQWGANFLMADGSVRWIGSQVDVETMKRLADPNDGQPVGDF